MEAWRHEPLHCLCRGLSVSILYLLPPIVLGISCNISAQSYRDAKSRSLWPTLPIVRKERIARSLNLEQIC